MPDAIACLYREHDLRLIGLAALLCALAALTTFTILDHARLGAKKSAVWILLAGLVAGVGIWSTHFISMLAFDPGVPVRYEPWLTLTSALAAVILTSAGWALSLARPRHSVPLTGLLVAAGICTMHYTGMAALRVPGQVVWQPVTVAVSVVVCALFTIWAANAQRSHNSILPWRPALLFVLGICSLHFTGMGAVTIVPQHGPVPSGPLIDRNALVALVLAGSVLIVALGFFVVLLDRVTDRETAAAKITYLAYHDALTGLSNRPMLDQHLACMIEQATAAGEPLALICVDLDGFKVVNDMHGHGAGDLLLVEVARRIQSTVRSDELVARIGGDEFIIIQRGGVQPRDAGLVAERVIEALKRPYTISGTTIVIGASAGIAMFPEDARTPLDLTLRADAALYLAKETGKGGIHFYHSSMEDIFRERRELETSIAGAIRDNLFTVHYQPIADLETGRIAGFEALLRWDHPELGAIQPDAFIGIAEQKGLIRELGMWVLEKACSDAATWDPPLLLAVNFSPLQFLEEDLADRVAAVVEKTGLDPSRLEIEVTENVLITRPEQALIIFNDLKAL